ncbi:hypothetical protein [Aquabacterium sp.]|jgi:hypothetical protein|uniref:hypothetical protein n=1 Tax=Aquabacterium sp. TaxID=1872578 RepID=UPI003BAE4E64
MPYSNELVTPADIEHYDLNSLWKRYYFVFTGLSWTIDRESESYLLLVRRNPEDMSTMAFAFLWDGELKEELLHMDGNRAADGRYLIRWRLLTKPLNAAPSGPATHHQARLAALKAALTAYKSRGLNSSSELSYAIEFEF